MQETRRVMMKREDIVKTINSLEGEAGHKKVLDVYNAQKPLPRGYKVQPSDPWCATTVSAVFLMNGYPDIAECSCVMMIKKAKDLGIWVEDDAYIPQPGDIVMYDWQDTGKGDNVGVADHTGIVISVSKRKITVREGNKNRSVGNRDILVNGVTIRGYIVPKYEIEEQPATSVSPKAQKTEKYKVGNIYVIIARSGLNVRTGAGTDYKKVPYEKLTSDGKKHAVGSALKYGTRVTCEKVHKNKDSIWIKIPSGWICAECNGKTYIK